MQRVWRPRRRCRCSALPLGPAAAAVRRLLEALLPHALPLDRHRLELVCCALQLLPACRWMQRWVVAGARAVMSKAGVQEVQGTLAATI